MLDTKREDILFDKYSTIAGIDEAGRGPWAGPVVIGGIILQKNDIRISGINDSKLLSAKKRAALYADIIHTHRFHISVISHTIIDAIGIGEAVVKGMREVLMALQAKHTLIDGYFPLGTFPDNTECVIEGDRTYYAIAAGSILAKHKRDTIMEEYDAIYPEYGFAQHKGYGTKKHLLALQEHDITEIHRKSYKPVKAFIHATTSTR